MVEEINGFEIVQDLGMEYQKDENGKILWKKCAKHWVMAICKECKREWRVIKNTLSRIKTCGCKKANQFQPLPESINGFKIIEDLGLIKNVRKAKVECRECFKEYITNAWQLVDRKNCGCKRKGAIVCNYREHNFRLVTIFSKIKNRCTNHKNINYDYYGGRGINICDEWMADANEFCKWALHNGYKENLSIDRIDNNKGYSPDNCRWTTKVIQARNRRQVILSMELARQMRKDYPELTQNEIAIKYGVSRATVSDVILNKSWKE